jgi:uncharacterized membrane protein
MKYFIKTAEIPSEEEFVKSYIEKRKDLLKRSPAGTMAVGAVLGGLLGLNRRGVVVGALAGGTADALSRHNIQKNYLLNPTLGENKAREQYLFRKAQVEKELKKIDHEYFKNKAKEVAKLDNSKKLRRIQSRYSRVLASPEEIYFNKNMI